jgi:hypothetical protein
MSSDNENDNGDLGQKAIVPRSGTDIAETTRRPNPVIARMTNDVLARAEARGLSAARYRVGGYLLREPDHRQILHWAEALSMTPECAKATGSGLVMRRRGHEAPGSGLVTCDAWV